VLRQVLVHEAPKTGLPVSGHKHAFGVLKT
jgi:hypothetical protein